MSVISFPFVSNFLVAMCLMCGAPNKHDDLNEKLNNNFWQTASVKQMESNDVSVWNVKERSSSLWPPGSELIKSIHNTINCNPPYTAGEEPPTAYF